MKGIRKKYRCRLDPGKLLFGVLGPRCWTGLSMLDCHVLNGFGTCMIGILERLY